MLSGGIVVGLAAGYFGTKKHFEDKYRQIAEEEIASVREHYRIVRKEGDLSDPRNLINAKDVDDMSKYVTETPIEEIDLETVVTVEHTTLSIFDTDFKEEADLLNKLLDERDEAKPYLITVAEYMESDNDKITLTYYEADEVLADEADQMVPDKEYVIGTNLSYFGVGSEDANVVYVRNHETGMDIEVIKNPNSYSAYVHGVTDWEYNDKPEKKVMKMRRGDE